MNQNHASVGSATKTTVEQRVRARAEAWLREKTAANINNGTSNSSVGTTVTTEPEHLLRLADALWACSSRQLSSSAVRRRPSSRTLLLLQSSPLTSTSTSSSSSPKSSSLLLGNRPAGSSQFVLKDLVLFLRKALSITTSSLSTGATTAIVHTNQQWTRRKIVTAIGTLHTRFPQWIRIHDPLSSSSSSVPSPESMVRIRSSANFSLIRQELLAFSSSTTINARNAVGAAVVAPLAKEPAALPPPREEPPCETTTSTLPPKTKRERPLGTVAEENGDAMARSTNTSNHNRAQQQQQRSGNKKMARVLSSLSMPHTSQENVALS